MTNWEFDNLQAIVNGKVTVGGLLIFGTEDNINLLLTDFRIDYLESLISDNS